MTAPIPRFVRQNLLLLLIGFCFLNHLPPAAGASAYSSAAILAELSAKDREKVLGGQQVLTTNNIAGAPWPEVVIFRRFPVPPGTVAAAFTNYARMSEINPNIISAELLSGKGAEDVVTYTEKVPVLGRATFTVRNHIIKKSAGGVTIQWTLLKSSCASSGNGAIVIEPMDGGSILRYSSKVTPSIPGASLLRSAAIRETADTVKYIAEYLGRTAAR